MPDTSPSSNSLQQQQQQQQQDSQHVVYNLESSEKSYFPSRSGSQLFVSNSTGSVPKSPSSSPSPSPATTTTTTTTVPFSSVVDESDLDLSLMITNEQVVKPVDSLEDRAAKIAVAQAAEDQRLMLKSEEAITQASVAAVAAKYKAIAAATAAAIAKDKAEAVTKTQTQVKTEAEDAATNAIIVAAASLEAAAAAAAAEKAANDAQVTVVKAQEAHAILTEKSKYDYGAKLTDDWKRLVVDSCDGAYKKGFALATVNDIALNANALTAAAKDLTCIKTVNDSTVNLKADVNSTSVRVIIPATVKQMLREEKISIAAKMATVAYFANKCPAEVASIDPESLTFNSTLGSNDNDSVNSRFIQQVKIEVCEYIHAAKKLNLNVDITNKSSAKSGDGVSAVSPSPSQNLSLSSTHNNNNNHNNDQQPPSSSLETGAASLGHSATQVSGHGSSADLTVLRQDPPSQQNWG